MKMEYINNIIGMAVHDGYLAVEKAIRMTNAEKLAWFESLSDQPEEVLL